MYREAVLKELWNELDAIVYRLMTDGKPEDWIDDRDPNPRNPERVGIAKEWDDWGFERGRAFGVAYSIAMVKNLSEPNVNWVREEAMRRWDEYQKGRGPADYRVDGVAVLRSSLPGGQCALAALGVLGVSCRPGDPQRGDSQQEARGHHGGGAEPA